MHDFDTGKMMQDFRERAKTPGTSVRKDGDAVAALAAHGIPTLRANNRGHNIVNKGDRKGRFAGAGVNFALAAGVQHMGTLGTPVALTALAFALGLLVIPFALETRGETLPA